MSKNGTETIFEDTMIKNFPLTWNIKAHKDKENHTETHQSSVACGKQGPKKKNLEKSQTEKT